MLRNSGVALLLAACASHPGASATSGGVAASTGGGSSSTGSVSASSTGTGSTSSSGGSSAGTSTGSTGTITACTTTAAGALRGSAIALTSDDSTLVSVNRDAGSVTVLSVDASNALSVSSELVVGNEPWQVVISACNDKAYVVLRRDQQVVEITNLQTVPAIGRSVSVGSEPTSLALTPNGTALYVANWVDGTLSVIDPSTFTVTKTIDLNATLAATGLLGPEVLSAARPGLAHPRAIAITNNGDASDNDETLYVTEWFAQRTAPETAGGNNADTNRKGLLYKIPIATGVATTIDLLPVTDTTFNDAFGNTTGCFPNQVGAVTIDGNFAYVSSTCASPKGPVGVFQKSPCMLDSQCVASNGSTVFGAAGSCIVGACDGACTIDAHCGVGSTAGACVASGTGSFHCKPDVENAKTTTHPAMSIVNLATGVATTKNLDALFADPASTLSATASARMPLLPTDVDFQPGFAYAAAEGADALFRLTVTAGVIGAVGANAASNFVDLQGSAAGVIHLPIGVAVSKDRNVAFVAEDATRSVSVVDLGVQTVASEVATSALPAAAAASIANGKALFTTGLDRWSLKGAAWGSCAACHIDGLSDGATWYFARGPRQTPSLDGTFSKSTSDQRALNWSATADEIADFESNVREISGGVGAIVATDNTPPVVADRINLIDQTPPQVGLQGSSAAAAAAGARPNDWSDIAHYVAQIRSPRAVTPTSAPAAIAAGRTTFQSAHCDGCHSGSKWTLSHLFYSPGNTPNDASGSAATESLSGQSWLTAASDALFLTTLYPSNMVSFQTMRSGAPLTFEQLQCELRPVGTITPNGATPTGVSSSDIGVQELRQNMVTGAQGGGGINANDYTAGYNIPSLLGLQVGAPYFHAGNARTLEELFNPTFFANHYQAISGGFSPDAPTKQQLIAYLLSIDTDTMSFDVPALGSGGGDICSYK